MKEREVMVTLVMTMYQVPYPQLCVVVWNMDSASTMFHYQIAPLLGAAQTAHLLPSLQQRTHSLTDPT